MSDIAAGILLAGESDRAVGDTINIGSGSEVSINELGRQIAAVTGGRAALHHDQPRPGDVLRLYADLSHARETLGFAPRVSLTEGLEKLLAWYRGQGATPQELLEKEIVRNWVPGAATLAR